MHCFFVSGSNWWIQHSSGFSKCSSILLKLCQILTCDQYLPFWSGVKRHGTRRAEIFVIPSLLCRSFSSLSGDANGIGYLTYSQHRIICHCVVNMINDCFPCASCRTSTSFCHLSALSPPLQISASHFSTVDKSEGSFPKVTSLFTWMFLAAKLFFCKYFRLPQTVSTFKNFILVIFKYSLSSQMSGLPGNKQCSY